MSEQDGVGSPHTYQDEAGTIRKEWYTCSGTEPTEGIAPFVTGCSNKGTYAEFIEYGDELWLLAYCEDHKHQMERFE